MEAYKWGFDMVGVNSVHSLAIRSLGPDVVILMEEEDARPPEFYFSSAHLNELTSLPQIRGRAIKLKTLLDGALILKHGYGFRPEAMHEMWAMDHFSRRGAPDPDMTVSTFSTAVCAKPLSRSTAKFLEENLLAGAIFAARTDTVVRGILESLGTNGITWISLYALTDTMKTNGMDEDAQAAAANVTKKEYKLFKHTANSFASIGIASRHGQTKDAPPPKPMSLERGSKIVLAATGAFVKRRNLREIAAAKIAEDLLEQAMSSPVATAPSPNAVPSPNVVTPTPTLPGSERPNAQSKPASRALIAFGALIITISVAAVALLAGHRKRR